MGEPPCCPDLKALGYEVGTGCLVGLPGQRIESLADDILLPGIGCRHGRRGAVHRQRRHSRGAANGSFDLSCRVMAITRLLLPDINIPATTAMETLPNGRSLALQRGANVVMPNVTEGDYRRSIALYPGKICIGDTPAHCRSCITGKIGAIGRRISQGHGFGRARAPEGRCWRVPEGKGPHEQPDGPGGLHQQGTLPRLLPLPALLPSEGDLDGGRAGLGGGRALHLLRHLHSRVPQGAKAFRSDVLLAARLVAPASRSEPAWRPRLPPPSASERSASSLRRLGFHYVGETAIGAYQVAQETRRAVEAAGALAHLHRLPGRGELRGALCPGEAGAAGAGGLADGGARPAHQGEAGPSSHVVFIGPCVAKKAEAEWPPARRRGRLRAHLRRAAGVAGAGEEILLSQCEASHFDEEPGEARLPAGRGQPAHRFDHHRRAGSCEWSSPAASMRSCEALACVGPTIPLVIEPLFATRGASTGR